MNRPLISRLTQQEDLNFLFTNRIPRQALTRFVGWLSKIENPIVSRLCIGIWKAFSDLDLSEAKEQHFKSMHDCFTRELKPGARPVVADPQLLASPCDCIVGAHGYVQDGMVLQAKGFPYALKDLLGDQEAVKYHEGCQYVTLRLTSSMYHRFHAPTDLTVKQVNYISGDTWNVNPIALKRIEALFCKNERAILKCEPAPGERLTVVAVAAVLVASIRLKFLDVLLHLKYRGPNIIPVNISLHRGEEMGWFEHGSTLVVFAPPGVRLAPGIQEGQRLNMGQPLLSRA